MGDNPRRSKHRAKTNLVLAEPSGKAPESLFACSVMRDFRYRLYEYTNQLTLGHDFLTLSRRNNITCHVVGCFLDFTRTSEAYANHQY